MEESAFEQIARRTRQRAVDTCRALGLDAMAADDIAQDVMLKLWSMREDLDKYHSIGALASLMAKHLSLNSMRRSRTVSIETGARRIEIATEAPDTLLESRENDEWLKRKMEELPATQHTILYMRQVERRKNSEIANLLGIEETSVSTLLARARRTLLEELRKRK